MDSCCFVCSESLVGCKIYSTFCGHLFHQNCIESSINKEKFCPECKTSCNSNQICKLFISIDPKSSGVVLNKKINENFEEARTSAESLNERILKLMYLKNQLDQQKNDQMATAQQQLDQEMEKKKILLKSVKALENADKDMKEKVIFILIGVMLCYALMFFSKL